MCLLWGTSHYKEKCLVLCLPWTILFTLSHLSHSQNLSILHFPFSPYYYWYFCLSSASCFCSLIIWIADCQCISKKVINLSLYSSALLLVLCCAPPLCQPLHFHCRVLQALLSAHGFHHFFSLAWLPSSFCFSKTLYYIFPHHLWSLTHFILLFWTRWVELK